MVGLMKNIIIKIIFISNLMFIGCSGVKMSKVSSNSIELGFPWKQWFIGIYNLPDHEIESRNSIIEPPIYDRLKDSLWKDKISYSTGHQLYFENDFQVRISFYNVTNKLDPNRKLNIAKGIIDNDKYENVQIVQNSIIEGFDSEQYVLEIINPHWKKMGFIVKQKAYQFYYEDTCFMICMSKMDYAKDDDHLFDDFIKKIKFVKI